MNITKSMAEAAATLLVKPIDAKIRAKSDELAYRIDSIVESRLPKEVLNTFQNYRNYFHTSSGFTFHSGSYSEHVQTSKQIPSKDNYYDYIEVDLEIIESIQKETQAINQIKAKKRNTYNSIVSTLLSLRTLKRVKEAFPKAYDYLKQYEEEKKTFVSLPIDTIMDTLKSYEE